MSQIGRTAEVRLRVPLSLNPHAEDREADFPAVSTNSRVVELMEAAAVKLVKPWLRPGESTLAVNLDVTYFRPLSREATVRAVATYAGGSERLHHFTIHAFDDTGLIASCEHTRAVASARRAVAAARRRHGLPSMLLEV